MEVKESVASYGPNSESSHLPRTRSELFEVQMNSEGWATVRLGDIGFFDKGRGVKKNQAESGFVPCIRYGELYTIHREIIRKFNSHISPEVAKSSKRIFPGDVLFAASGETKAEIGKCAAFIDEVEAYAGGDIIIFRPAKHVADPRFLGYLLNMPSVAAQKASKGQGDAVVHITTTSLSSLVVSMPRSSTEQAAIADALNDADALIESLEQLIAKKRQIKQGTMQTLLTGKQRLPGFVESWQTRKIGDLLSIMHGKSQHAVEEESGIYPILATGGQIGLASGFLYDKPSVLIGRKGTIDRPQYMDTPFWSVDTLFYSVVHEPNVAKYLFYRFCLIDWRHHNEASGVPSLNARTIEQIEIEVPEGDEQSAIATVLTDMDTELAELETRLVKTRQLKQGMMQDLLTGRIRLI